MLLDRFHIVVIDSRYKLHLIIETRHKFDNKTKNVLGLVFHTIIQPNAMYIKSYDMIHIISISLRTCYGMCMYTHFYGTFHSIKLNLL